MKYDEIWGTYSLTYQLKHQSGDLALRRTPAQKPRASRLLCHSPRNWFQRKPDRKQWNLHLCVYIYVDSICTWKKHICVYNCIYICIYKPGGLFIEPTFSTFAVFVIDFLPQITVVLHFPESANSLKSTRVLLSGNVKNLSGALIFSALSGLDNLCKTNNSSVASNMWGSARRHTRA